jgi:tetratricopeptide (TPR) repeat protein
MPPSPPLLALLAGLLVACAETRESSELLAEARGLIDQAQGQAPEDRIARARQAERLLAVVIEREPCHEQALIAISDAQLERFLGAVEQRPEALASPPAEPLEHARQLVACHPDSEGAKDAEPQYWLRVKQPDKAVERYLELRRAEPGYPHWPQRAAEAMLSAGDHRRLVTFVEGELESNRELGWDQHRYMLHLLGQSYTKLGEVEAARRAFERGITAAERSVETGAAPFSACPYQGLGELYQASGRDQEALELYLESAQRSEDDPDAWLRVATQAHRMGLEQQALEHLARARAIGHRPGQDELERDIRTRLALADDPLARLQAAVHAFDRYDFDLAAHLTGEGFGAERSPEIRLLEVFTLIHQARYAEAQEALAALGQAEPWMPGIAVAHAHIAIAEKDAAQAERLVDRADGLRSTAPAEKLEAQPKPWVTMVRRMGTLARAWAASNRAQHGAAIVLFDQILSHAPNDIFALLGRANSATATGDLDTAQRLLEQVLEHDADNQYATAELALVYYNRGDDEAAKLLFEKARMADPERYTCPYEGLGMLALRQGHTTEAEDLFQRAIAINPDIEFAKYNGLARIRMRAGALDEARTLLEKSLANHPDNPEGLALLEELEALEAQRP